ncbi:MAG: mechanosensitive ion channel family protein [Microgenomates group bacterium]
MLNNQPEGVFYRIIFSLIILIFYIILSGFLKRSVDRLLKISEGRILMRTKTLRSFIKSILDGVLFITVFLIILSYWGVNITPILTGAGILGLAISFGAQTLIKDLISGFFILIENQFNVGDKVKIGNFEGEVYKMTMRMTVLKDEKDNLIFIPNSQIASVVKLKEGKST